MTDIVERARNAVADGALNHDLLTALADEIERFSSDKYRDERDRYRDALDEMASMRCITPNTCERRSTETQPRNRVPLCVVHWARAALEAEVPPS